jgi:hypothetical protein
MNISFNRSSARVLIRCILADLLTNFDRVENKPSVATILYQAVKGIVSCDRFQQILHKFTELGLTKGRGWFLDFLGTPIIL